MANAANETVPETSEDYGVEKDPDVIVAEAEIKKLEKELAQKKTDLESKRSPETLH